ncbi:MAG: RrF2 family transcriptional regulator [Actinomycetes bacterium]
MRISAKSDYAVRAMAQIAADGGVSTPIKAEQVSQEQNIPLNFLLGILRELKQALLLRSQRGPDGGYLLRRPASEISLADVIRAVDGPLAQIRDVSMSELTYDGPAEILPEVWMAVRSSLRAVLENVSVADLVSSRLPKNVRTLADRYKERPGP